MSKLEDKPEDGTDMPHTVPAPPDGKIPSGAARFLTEKARNNKADGSEPPSAGKKHKPR